MAQVLDSEFCGSYTESCDVFSVSDHYEDLAEISQDSDPSCDSLVPEIESNYTLYRPLARGCNGQVSLGNYNGELVAIKQSLNYYNTTALTREVEALLLLRQYSDQDHQFVGELLAVDCLPNPSAAIFRFYGKGSLESFLQKHPALREAKRLSFMIDVSSALKFIHSAGVLHKDLKAENILIDEDGTLRITDFGCATSMTDTATDFGGDIFTRSPKMLENTRIQQQRKKENASNPTLSLENFSQTDDIYSLALVLYHIATGQLPFAQFRQTNGFKSYFNYVVVEKQRPDTGILKGSAKLITLLNQCWHDDEKSRPAIETVHQNLFSQQLSVKSSYC